MWRANRFRWFLLLVLMACVLWVSARGADDLERMTQWFSQLGSELRPGGQPKIGQREDNDEAGEADENVPAIGPSTLLIFRTFYIPCNLEAREEYHADVSQLGQSKEQFHMYHPDWQIVEFSSDRVVAEREVRDECDELLAFRTVKLHGGQVKVFFGRGGPHSPVMTVIDVTADKLLEGDRSRLEEGVTVEDESEVWLILEGLAH